MVLKRHASPHAIARLALSHTMEVHLNRCGFPVAALQFSQRGDTLVQVGPASYSLHRVVPGTQFSISQREDILGINPDLAGSLGTLLGTMHDLTASLERPPGNNSPTVSQLLAGPRHAIRTLKRARPPAPAPWWTLRLKPFKSEFDEWIIRVMPHVTMIAERIAVHGQSSQHGQPDLGPIHHDIHWENLIFDEALQVRAVIDFDNAIWAPRIIEVGAAAAVLVGAEEERLEEFIRAYERCTGTALDRHDVRLWMARKCVHSILYSVNSYLTGGRARTATLAPWCIHLYEVLEELEWS